MCLTLRRKYLQTHVTIEKKSLLRHVIKRDRGIDRHVGPGLSEQLGNAFADPVFRSPNQNHFAVYIKGFWSHDHVPHTWALSICSSALMACPPSMSPRAQLIDECG